MSSVNLAEDDGPQMDGGRDGGALGGDQKSSDGGSSEVPKAHDEDETMESLGGVEQVQELGVSHTPQKLERPMGPRHDELPRRSMG